MSRVFKATRKISSSINKYCVSENYEGTFYIEWLFSGSTITFWVTQSRIARENKVSGHCIPFIAQFSRHDVLSGGTKHRAEIYIFSLKWESNNNYRVWRSPTTASLSTYILLYILYFQWETCVIFVAEGARVHRVSLVLATSSSPRAGVQDSTAQRFA